MIDQHNPEEIREIVTYSISFSGAYKLMTILFDLEVYIVFTYATFPESYKYYNGAYHIPEGGLLYDDLESAVRQITKESNAVGFYFADRFAMKFMHVMIPRAVREPIVRIVRDPRDPVISRFEYYRSMFREDSSFSLDEALDMPLLYGQGELFQLGSIEESVLQEYLLPTLMPKKNIHYMYFEDVEASEIGVQAIEGLCKYIGIDRSRESILKALKNSGREHVKAFGGKDSGKKEKWKLRESSSLIRRYDLICSVLGNNQHPRYLCNSASIPKVIRWPEEIYLEATKLWVLSRIIRLSSRFDLPVEAFSDYAPILFKFCILLEQIPLLEISIARALLQSGQHFRFAYNILENYLFSNDRLHALYAGAALSKVAAEHPVITNRMNEILNAGNVNEKERDFLNLLLKHLGESCDYS